VHCARQTWNHPQYRTEVSPSDGSRPRTVALSRRKCDPFLAVLIVLLDSPHWRTPKPNFAVGLPYTEAITELGTSITKVSTGLRSALPPRPLPFCKALLWKALLHFKNISYSTLFQIRSTLGRSDSPQTRPHHMNIRNHSSMPNLQRACSNQRNVKEKLSPVTPLNTQAGRKVQLHSS
jgi:hypothetical protein